MSGDRFQRVADCMTIGFDKRQNGIGSDPDALRAKDRDERQAAEALLLEYLRAKPD